MSRSRPPKRWTGLTLSEATVTDVWGFVEATRDADGATVLFIGPPGTGKTMAAELVGRELSLDLFRVDLSRVVSKYVGETEKNLAKVFNRAEHKDLILFFDEADALFAKRTEVKDSHDRYGNLETNYLMERIEEYSGLVIIAVNRREVIDEEVEQRFDYTIPFPARRTK